MTIRLSANQVTVSTTSRTCRLSTSGRQALPYIFHARSRPTQTAICFLNPSIPGWLRRSARCLPQTLFARPTPILIQLAT